MTSRFLALGAVAALTAISAVSAVGPQRPQLFRANLPGTSHLHAFGSRSAQQTASATGAKFDAALADISRHLNRVRPDHALSDLHSLNPAARFVQRAGGTPMVLIDAVTRGDVQQLKTALIGLGLQHGSAYSNDVGGWLPVAQLDAATALGELQAIRAAMPRTRTGSVTSQGDFAQHSDLVRSANALTGAGVTVGVLSDSFDCYAVYAANGVPAGGNEGYAYNGFTATAATDISTGDLPANVNVLEEAEAGNGGCMNYGAPTQEPFSDEGRAMLQVVYDVAPGASLAFYTAENSEADFANGIVKLAAPVSSGGAGATVIADDVGYFDEPFFQDGIVAQAVDKVQAQGVAYFSAAGNDGTLAYDNNAPVFPTAGSGPTAGEMLLNFDTSNATTNTLLPITIPPLQPGEFVAIVLEWDQSYLTGCTPTGPNCGAANQLNLCVTGVTGNDVITDDTGNAETCTGANALNQDPVQILIVGNNANGPDMTTQETFNIVVGLAGGTTPGRVKVAVEGDGIPLTINQFATNSATIQGHPGAAGAMAIGAAFFLQTPACGTTPATLEYYSSAGGDPILFNVDGSRIAAPAPRQKPDFVGPDGGNDTFLGFTLASAEPPIVDNSTTAGCQNNANYPNFFGTSAATPHIAGIAALFLQSNPALTLTQLYDALSETALPMGAPIPNYSSGYGFVQADAAAAKITAALPAAPTLTLASTSIIMGDSTTITWSSANNQGCTASGTWNGAEASSGMQTLTPAAVGSYSYSLLCTNNTGPSPTAMVTLIVTAGSSGAFTGHSGGGSLGLATLLGLCAMCLTRLRTLRLRRRETVAKSRSA
jgi:hypothetical protein